MITGTSPSRSAFAASASHIEPDVGDALSDESSPDAGPSTFAEALAAPAPNGGGTPSLAASVDRVVAARQPSPTRMIRNLALTVVIEVFMSSLLFGIAPCDAV